MAKKNYPEEFRRNAVELYRATEGATVAAIAADLGIAYGSLSAWLKAAGVAVRRHGTTTTTTGDGPDESPDQELARLRAKVRELEAEKSKLNTERDILRAAAKYFANETRW